MDILRKSLAPISKEAWELINEEAKDTLVSSLSVRKFVEVAGPKGLNHAAVALGELEVPKNQEKNKVKYGIHKVQPLVEIRIPFELDIWELDNLARGKEAINLDPLTDAAKEIAKFEENAVYKGFKEANINGLLTSSEHEVLKLNAKMDNFNSLISKALIMFKEESISGPFDLVVGSEIFKYINKFSNDYPLKKHLRDQIQGEIILSDHLEGALLVAKEEDSLRLTLGQDFSIGYQAHDSKKVQLYITESFTFQILDPATYIVIK